MERIGNTSVILFRRHALTKGDQGVNKLKRYRQVFARRSLHFRRFVFTPLRRKDPRQCPCPLHLIDPDHALPASTAGHSRPVLDVANLNTGSFSKKPDPRMRLVTSRTRQVQAAKLGGLFSAADTAVPAHKPCVVYVGESFRIPVILVFPLGNCDQ